MEMRKQTRLDARDSVFRGVPAGGGVVLGMVAGGLFWIGLFAVLA